MVDVDDHIMFVDGVRYVFGENADTNHYCSWFGLDLIVAAVIFSLIRLGLLTSAIFAPQDASFNPGGM